MYQKAMLTLESWLNDLPPSMRQAAAAAAIAARGRRAHARPRRRGGQAAGCRHRQAAGTRTTCEALAVARVRRGHAYLFLGSYEQAIQDATAAMKMTEGKDDMQAAYADALRLRGLNRYQQGRSLDAVEDLEKALNIYVRLGDSDRDPAPADGDRDGAGSAGRIPEGRSLV